MLSLLFIFQAWGLMEGHVLGHLGLSAYQYKNQTTVSLVSFPGFRLCNFPLLYALFNYVLGAICLHEAMMVLLVSSVMNAYSSVDRSSFLWHRCLSNTRTVVTLLCGILISCISSKAPIDCQSRCVSSSNFILSSFSLCVIVIC